MYPGYLGNAKVNSRAGAKTLKLSQTPEKGKSRKALLKSHVRKTESPPFTYNTGKGEESRKAALRGLPQKVYRQSGDDAQTENLKTVSHETSV